MARWEMRMYAYGVGHVWTMYSDAKLSNVKKNMTRRFNMHIEAGMKVALFTIKDMKDNGVVYLRRYNQQGIPKFRSWNCVKYRSGPRESFDWEREAGLIFKSMEDSDE